MLSVNVKHAGKKYEVEVDPESTGEVFKNQLFSLTGVPPERQKILVKGGQLKDDTLMNSVGLKEGQTLMLLGSAAALPKAPEKQAVFLEDMTDAQKAETLQTPPGLVNLGNTCYLNSSLQAMRTIPELQEGLKTSGAAPGTLTNGLNHLYTQMSKTTQPFQPYAFVIQLREHFPQFAEQTQGMYKQQDAEEAWSSIFSVLARDLKDDHVAKYMGGRYETKLICDEAPERAPVMGTEDFSKLHCHISISTNYLVDGLQAGLTETLEKNDDELGRNASFTKTRRITRLPKYLTVQYVRFFWRRDTQKKSKILRKVIFPINELDVTPLCSEDLKQKLIPVRDRVREIGKEKEDARRAAKRAKMNEEVGATGEVPADEIKQKDKEYAEEIEQLTDSDLKNDVGANTSGLYNLQAIVTHQGASADSGHYQAFVRNEKEPGKWWKFNDDKVTEVDEAKIESLAGGGESDSALILLYKSFE
ncbi:Ubiquitin carboxyl-terminal hydrolase 6 [Yarrowia sp. C11]|nr:Ubiquitin carboxyl-terminal hydrolase 6 [Yarrowia sp. E02]KAG5369120.1 Ubiquitin carboxyl-terminal hydrolase 6 [Yarrowia sp. C11]